MLLLVLHPMLSRMKKHNRAQNRTNFSYKYNNNAVWNEVGCMKRSTSDTSVRKQNYFSHTRI